MTPSVLIWALNKLLNDRVYMYIVYLENIAFLHAIEKRSCPGVPAVLDSRELRSGVLEKVVSCSSQH